MSSSNLTNHTTAPITKSAHTPPNFAATLPPTKPNHAPPTQAATAATSQPNTKPATPPTTHSSQQNFQGTSWADRIRVSGSKSRFNLEQVDCTIEGDVPKLVIDDALIDESATQWTRCLVGFFPGYVMPYQAIKSIAMRAWKSYGLEHVMSSEGFTIFRFNEEEGVHRVLEEGPWMFGGKHIVLQQWHAHTSFDMNRISKVPVWVRLHGVPLPLWTQRGLSTVSSVVGRPLSCDKQTYECTRLSYARVCVELDATRAPLQKFEIQCCLSSDPIEVKVEYEWKPKRCAKCGLFGHNCQPKEKETKPKEDAQAASFGPSGSTISEKGKAVAIETRVMDEAKADSQAIARQVQAPEIKATGKNKSSNQGVERRDADVGPLAMVLVTDQTQCTSSDLDTDPDSPIAIEEDQDGLLGIGECVLNRSASLSESPNRFAVLDRSKSLAITSKAVDSSSKAVVPPLVTPRTRARSKRGAGPRARN
ncbi:uncharacterized protein LOC123208249 [Mangifera indica]|uniref:uncharacterized protein LOC123208228 n=1 Tax=Mangifera indica TaxID=29780 RepID=UPI001CFA960C|nr:uncharacterized protein LOC123208228 [Mangifera indica]XP_044481560.1 uncharacterized protein LOC123208249 [Mangifera indica]